MVTDPWKILMILSIIHLLFSFMSLSDISYIIIVSIHVVKGNIKYFTDPGYDQHEKWMSKNTLQN